MRCGTPTTTLRLTACLGLALAVLLPASGCSKARTKKSKTKVVASARVAEDDASEEAAEEVAAEEVTAESLTGVDPDTALAVDKGRLTVMSPQGWIRADQSRNYLVKFVPSRKKTFPSIVITVSEPPEGLSEIDADTQREFVKAIADSLAATFTKNGKSTLVKKPAAVQLGPHRGVTWAAPATIKVAGVNESIDRSSYAVVLGGRMYTIEVRAPKDRLDAEGRAAAKAVASALRAAEPAAVAPAAEPPAAEPAAAAAAEAAQ